jgi:hypothetical protein
VIRSDIELAFLHAAYERLPFGDGEAEAYAGRVFAVADEDEVVVA